MGGVQVRLFIPCGFRYPRRRFLWNDPVLAVMFGILEWI
jgi:hypothetical protein